MDSHSKVVPPQVRTSSIFNLDFFNFHWITMLPAHSTKLPFKLPENQPQLWHHLQPTPIRFQQKLKIFTKVWSNPRWSELHCHRGAFVGWFLLNSKWGTTANNGRNHESNDISEDYRAAKKVFSSLAPSRHLKCITMEMTIEWLLILPAHRNHKTIAQWNHHKASIIFRLENTFNNNDDNGV